MSAITLEVSAHRIGGSDRYERVFQPRYETFMIGRGASAYIQLPARNRPSEQLYIHFYDWTIVRDGLMSAECHLKDCDGAPIVPPRPVLASMLPCDIPLHSAHIAQDPDHGVISLGLRSPARVWTPGELALAKTDPLDARACQAYRDAHRTERCIAAYCPRCRTVTA